MLKPSKNILEYCLYILDKTGNFPSYRTIEANLPDEGVPTTIGRHIRKWAQQGHLTQGDISVGCGYYGPQQYPRMLAATLSRIGFDAFVDGNTVVLRENIGDETGKVRQAPFMFVFDNGECTIKFFEDVVQGIADE